MTFLLVNFAVKNAMFNLNENNRFVMAQHPSDMRIGVNGMCGQVRAVGLDHKNTSPRAGQGMGRGDRTSHPQSQVRQGCRHRR